MSETVTSTTLPAIHPEHRMLIDGKLVEAENGATFANINPATEQESGRVADASVGDIQRAIAAARRAFDETDWSTDHELRKRTLQQLQDALEEDREELREQLIQEVGCPRMSTFGPQLDWIIAESLKTPIELIDQFEWEHVNPGKTGPDGKPNAHRILKEPIGVVGAIAPWNYPFNTAITKLSQALATGNTVILKPAPDTPWNTTYIGKLVAERTDIPPGVLNVVTTADNAVAEEFTLSPLVDMISFTGSTRTGQRITEKGAATMKRIFTELGGKSASIVLDDADLETALAGTALPIVFHGGQACAIGTRLVVPRERYDEAVEKLATMMSSYPYGDPQRPDVLMGPLVSKVHRDRVLGFIESGKRDGARLVVGGGIPASEPTGWFVEPTLFADVTNDMEIGREEIFGPVLSVMAHDGDDDAIRIANASPYGLAGYVYGSTERAVGVAKRIRAGMLSVNGPAAHGALMPFGGYKMSGQGRQNGIAGFDQHLQIKALAWVE